MLFFEDIMSEMVVLTAACSPHSGLEMKTVKCRGCQIAGRFPSRLLWWACFIVCVRVGVSGLKVKFGVLLPERPYLQTSICATLPLTMAEESLIAEDLAPFNWVVVSSESSYSLIQSTSTSTAEISVQFDYSNTECTDLYGPFCAMEIYYRGVGCGSDERPTSESIELPDVLAFYGPCCNYALSPVARYVGLWGVPIITPGGLKRTFGTDPAFATLTRFIAPYEKFAPFLLGLLSKYGWRYVSFLLHDNIGKDKVHGRSMCCDIVDSVLALLPGPNDKETNGTNETKVQAYERFNENYYDEEQEDIEKTMNEISNVSRSKCLTGTVIISILCRSQSIIIASGRR